MHVKWSNYALTLFVRSVCGAVVGLLAGLGLAFFAGGNGKIHRAHSPLVELIQQERYRPLLIWLGVAGVAGAVISVASIPRWQTPWYKGALDSDDPDKKTEPNQRTQ